MQAGLRSPLGGGAAGGRLWAAYCLSRKTIGTSTIVAIGSPSRVAGLNFQRRTASEAALSSRGNPLDLDIVTVSARPAAFT